MAQHATDGLQRRPLTQHRRRGRVAQEMRPVGRCINLCEAQCAPVEESLAGFANPNVVLIGAMFVIGEALARTGVARSIGDWLVTRGGQSPWRLLVLLMLAVGFLGSVMSSTGVVAIFIPVVLRIASRSRIAPGQLMMPMAYAALISGMMTLVATSPNLVINSIPPLTPKQVLLMLSAGEVPQRGVSSKATDRAGQLGFYLGKELLGTFIESDKAADRLLIRSGEHVTDDQGTGFVHTAPGHGREDFEIWMEHGRALADERFDSAVAEAEARAAAIELATASRVERLRSAVEPRLEALAIRMLDIVVPRSD